MITPTATLPMTTATDILTLTQWFSPSYPLGSFAYSHGLETAVQDGWLDSAAALEDWLRDVLAHGAGRCDAILLRAGFACDGPEALGAVDAAALAYAASAERVLETTAQGTAFARTTQDIWADVVPAQSLPVAVGYAAARRGLPLDLTVTLYVQAFASALVSGAVRLVPLGQTEGQVVLQRLGGLCESITRRSQGATLDDLGGSCFGADIAAMRHETLEHRIFRT
ncbi:urease accessory protein UreF [uncultured Sulfitobacter sp.]|uniref:urease accessory protein UreF n=1 Tax=uncultured Sulfitobacter sp. TaxID=191468 RepID=UPI002636435D|nr:urease accessory UreF family protein [uncultured Sulfitobacter sp.]